MTVSKPQRVLVVEDEYFLADDLKVALDLEGVTVIGPVGSEAGAMAMLEDASIDCAILDINLHGQMVYPLARALQDRNVPFMFVSGYDSAAAGEGFDDIELLQKPFTTEAVMQEINRLTSGKTSIAGR